MKPDRDTLSLLLGIGVLILGIALIVFTLYSFISIATNPNSFLRQPSGLAIPIESQASGPTAAFRWQTNGDTLSVQDLSQPGGAVIVNWTWNAGDGRGVGYGQTIPSYTYVQAGTYTISLTVRDANQITNSAQTTIQVPSNANGNAGPAGGGGGNNGGNNSGNNQGGCTGSNCNGSFGGTSLLQAGAVILTVTMHIIMAYTGVLFIRAGWGLLRPRGATLLVPMGP